MIAVRHCSFTKYGARIRQARQTAVLLKHIILLQKIHPVVARILYQNCGKIVCVILSDGRM